MKKMVDYLASKPPIFDALRWILEFGYAGEKAVIDREVLANGKPRPDKKVLDLGCGTGSLAGRFHREAYLGVDLNESYIRWARRKRPSYSFEVMNAQSLALGSESFDLVLISGVIHHVSDDEAARILAEAQRVLKPAGGRLVLWEDVPTRNRWNRVGALVHQLDEGEHIRKDQQYLDLVEKQFRVLRSYPMRSGVCDYVVIIGEKR